MWHASCQSFSLSIKMLINSCCLWILIMYIYSGDATESNAIQNDHLSQCEIMDSCQYFDEFFTDTKLEMGYNYVTTIPKGALNITIKQMIKTYNLLALRSPSKEDFIINGDKLVAESGVYHYHGDAFNYNKENALITSKGPLINPVVLMLLVNAVNPGLRYTYTLLLSRVSNGDSVEVNNQWNELGQPLDVNEVVEQRRRRHLFSWKLLGFGQCSRSCGPGIQSPIFRCIRESSERYYAPKRCTHIPKPQFSEDIYHCNHGLCPAYWHIEDWTTCHCPSNSTKSGKQYKLAKCIQEQANGLLEKVEEAKCLQNVTKPIIQERLCQCSQLVKRQLNTLNSNNSKLITQKTLIQVSQQSTSNANSTNSIKPGVWLMSNWNQQCAIDCDLNFEHRSIYCDRTAPYTDLCDVHSTPIQRRPCISRTGTSCSKWGKWFTSEWSKCSGECFNLKHKRTVLCILNGTIVDDSHCKLEDKPETLKNCTNQNIDSCTPAWHYSEWSMCSRTCGEGVQRRYAKCLEYNWNENALIESNKCKSSQREPVYGVCKISKCKDHENDQEEPLIETIEDHLSGGMKMVKTKTKMKPKMAKRAQDPLLTIRSTNRQNPLIIIPTEHKDKDPEKLVIAAVPKTIKNCNDELNNCKRLNRERLCKLNYFRSACCLTCYGYY